MKRSFERKLMYVASGWQIFTGLITIFIYTAYLRDKESHMGKLTFVEQKGLHSIFDSLSTFTYIFGLLFITIACINIFIVKKYVKDHTLQYKVPIYWVVLAIAFYFLNDYISVALCLSTVVITLSKNKAIRFQKAAGHL